LIDRAAPVDKETLVPLVMILQLTSGQHECDQNDRHHQ